MFSKSGAMGASEAGSERGAETSCKSETGECSHRPVVERFSQISDKKMEK